ncbi:acyl-CoA dehydrogenase [Sulfitobacter sp. D35]|uniref:acyl-CoA dehydrogenase family protein n=1 Tax=Sulfitobacter sp. D35 TaxID=3083252 RepID=UPI00296E4DC7|nr:acyl-CoA dehydrogenase [Sulfitobacter sp. D35]MDW4498836.1 acyl-CoA dehydrogenase [Sulfitobacter sp. D35]
MTTDIEAAEELALRVEEFVRETVVPFEADPRRTAHGPQDALVQELRGLAKAAGVLTPHIHPDGSHFSQVGTARLLIASGLSPLGPLACNTAAPDEGNMFLLGRMATPAQKQRFLEPLVSGRARSAFFMTEPAAQGGAGSDPSMLSTCARRDGNHWVIDGRKAFITGADGAGTGIIMARAEEGATLFLVELPDPVVRIERILDTIDSAMPGGHAVVAIEGLRLDADQILGQPGDGFRLAQVRLAPARLSHCMRWTGLGLRAQEIATAYACRREAFAKTLVDHEGVGFMLAENQIDLRQCRLMIDWCAQALDRGETANVESSMAKVAVSEALFRVADRCVQIMGGTGVTGDTIVEQFFREIRAFRIYDGPTEVHKWSLARKIKRDFAKTSGS